MLADLGTIGLMAALALAAFGLVAAAIGQRRNRPALIAGSHRALYAIAGVLTFCMVALAYAFLARDYSISFVARHSNRDMPAAYAFSALWGGQEGSLLLWVWLQSLYGALAVRTTRTALPQLAGSFAAIFHAILLFFSVTLVFAADPFSRLFPLPTDGGGLNPLLQHPLMVIHPPMLYLGFVGTSVPFAFALAALMHKRVDPLWIHLSRKWTLFCWMCLTTGIVLGGHWAYLELGWGGYWAWDPVENASFMPWLTMTAYFHSTMVQERRRLLAGWNVVLAILSYTLSVFGTFLTRSGVISSVHSFALSNIGPFFLGFVALTLVVAFGLFIVQFSKMKGPREEQIEHPVSRESAILINNLFLVSSTFVVLWGTIFPVLSEAFQGKKLSVGAPFFNSALAPVGLALLFLMGTAQVIPWRKASAGRLVRNLGIPVLAGAAAVAAAWRVTQHPTFSAGAGLSAFVAAGLLWDVAVSIRARRRLHGEATPDAFVGVFSRQRRRVGGFVSHVGIALIGLGIMGSLFNEEKEMRVEPGQTVSAGRYSLHFKEFVRDHQSGYFSYGALFDVENDGKALGQLRPERRLYPNQNDPTTEVGLLKGLGEDLYIVLADFDREGKWVVLKTFVKPLVSLVWLGWLVLLVGSMWAFMGRSLALSPRPTGTDR
ncbi:MAG: heme lyase CcmF/NrfE family subunit [Nitrospirae bacterium]|nr:heme lyase CcmF/NrfE family subunit [Nitrospirota bacterium]